MGAFDFTFNFNVQLTQCDHSNAPRATCSSSLNDTSHVPHFVCGPASRIPTPILAMLGARSKLSPLTWHSASSNLWLFPVPARPNASDGPFPPPPSSFPTLTVLGARCKSSPLTWHSTNSSPQFQPSPTPSTIPFHPPPLSLHHILPHRTYFHTYICCLIPSPW